MQLKISLSIIKLIRAHFNCTRHFFYAPPRKSYKIVALYRFVSFRGNDLILTRTEIAMSISPLSRPGPAEYNHHDSYIPLSKNILYEKVGGI